MDPSLEASGRRGAATVLRAGHVRPLHSFPRRMSALGPALDFTICGRPRPQLHARDGAHAAHPGRRALCGRGGAEQPRAHRAGQSDAQLLLLRLSGRGARASGRGGPGGRRRRRAGAPARRAGRDQGPDADGGQDDDDGLVRLRALRSRPKRAHRRQAARGRRDHGRQDDDAGVRLLELHGEPAVGDHAEPVESREDAWRLLRRRRRGGGVRLRTARRGEATWADRYASRRRGRARSG